MRSQRSQSAYSQKAPSVKSRGGLSAADLNNLNNNDRKSKQGDALSIRSRGMSAYSKSKPADMMSYASSRKSKATEVYSEINENDEWTAIQKFNAVLHFEEQKQSAAREAERKRLMKKELDQ